MLSGKKAKYSLLCVCCCLDKIKGADRDIYKVPVGRIHKMLVPWAASREEDKKKMKNVYSLI